MLRDHEEPHGHHVVILPLVVCAGSISISSVRGCRPSANFNGQLLAPVLLRP